jgi:hypothetical protein
VSDLNGPTVAPSLESSTATRGTLLILAWSALLAACLWQFTADDAYIVYRYAENAAAGQGLVYNAGETISALTSPGHALVCTLLAVLQIPLQLGNKVLGMAGLVFSGLLVSRHVACSPSVRSLALLLVVGSPLAVVWSVGGLETSLLMLGLTSLVVLSPSLKSRPRDSQLAWYSLLAGACFLLRHDSALFLTPCVVHQIGSQLRRPRATVRPVLLLSLPAAALSFGWLGFSAFYYHDVLPTSFYTKTPSFNWPWMALNAIYMVQFVLLTGLVLLFLASRRSAATDKTAPSPLPAAGNPGQQLGVSIGLAVTFVYGLGMVTSHMMFAYRFLLPYLPVAVILTAGLAGRRRAVASGSARLELTLACCLQLGMLACLLWVSLNPGAVGEYRHLTISQYSQFLATLDSQAEKIRQHWNTHPGPDRRPIIFVYAAGRIGHQLQTAHVVDGNLLSYRHVFADRNEPSGVSLSADYVMAIVGSRHGSLDQQLGGRLQDYQRIARTTFRFDGQQEHFDLYFNKNPAPLRLPRYIDGSLDSDASTDRSMQ